MKKAITDGADKIGYPVQIIMYIIAGALIVFSATQRLDEVAYGLGIAYLVYDFWFFRNEGAFHGRGVKVILEDIRAACGYMAYFLPLAGFALAFSDADQIKALLKHDPGLFKYLLVALVAAVVATLFIPVRYAVSATEPDVPTPGLKLCFTFVLFLQKVAITAMACAVLRAGLVAYQVGLDSLLSSTP